eukprot:TRINITY_DN43469_c0_g1_i1.p1 TRINITY_DN43469_c0_g1~~TRINITY_DN43469_c0_g1_i1.p1  ORF type:complete len:356 (+),score=52.13 TRINITY_DN43469_c0_g1_i1:62-1069(+)
MALRLMHVMAGLILSLVLFAHCPRTWVTSQFSQRRGAEALTQRSASPDGEAAKPVVAVLGAGGRTGALVVEALLRGGKAKPRALTRSGTWQPVTKDMTVTAEDVETGSADVTDKASLLAALAGASAVVFAAAYSRGKSEPKDVDNAGLVKTAEAVLEVGVERLVVVSSAAVTRPYSPVGILLNTVGSGVLNEKLEGEKAIKKMLKGTGSTYTIVRPGGLKDGGALGPGQLTFNQGDTYVADVPRADVAAVCAVAATDPANPGGGKTFEMFKSGNSQSPLMPWYKGKKRYMVRGSECGASCRVMLSKLRPDKEVYDVPGPLPFGVEDFQMKEMGSA